MSLEFTNIVHTRAEAFEILKLIAARHGRTLCLETCSRALGRRRKAGSVELCDALIDLLAAAFGVCGKELRSPLRGKRETSRIRQIGMYIAHTSFGMAMSEVAVGFSRDRTTVMHACHLVEDMRDDRDFDTIITSFERIVHSAFTAWRNVV